MKFWDVTFNYLCIFLCYLMAFPPSLMAQQGQNFAFEHRLEKWVRGGEYFQSYFAKHYQLFQNPHFANQSIYDTQVFMLQAGSNMKFGFDAAHKRVYLLASDPHQSGEKTYDELGFRFRLIKNRSNNLSLLLQVQSPVSQRFINQLSGHPLGQFLRCSTEGTGCARAKGTTNVLLGNFQPWLRDDDQFYVNIWGETNAAVVQELPSEQANKIEANYLAFYESLPENARGVSDISKALSTADSVMPDFRETVLKEIFGDDLRTRDAFENFEKRIINLYTNDPMLGNYLSFAFKQPHELGMILLQAGGGEGGKAVAFWAMVSVLTVAGLFTIFTKFVELKDRLYKTKVSKNRIKKEKARASRRQSLSDLEKQAEDLQKDIDRQSRKASMFDDHIKTLENSRAKLVEQQKLNPSNDLGDEIKRLKADRKKALKKLKNMTIGKGKILNAISALGKLTPALLFAMGMLSAFEGHSAAPAQPVNPSLPNQGKDNVIGSFFQNHIINQLQPELLDPTFLKSKNGLVLNDFKPLFFLLTFIHMQYKNTYPYLIEDIFTHNFEPDLFLSLPKPEADFLFDLDDQKNLVFSEAFYASADHVASTLHCMKAEARDNANQTWKP